MGPAGPRFKPQPRFGPRRPARWNDRAGARNGHKAGGPTSEACGGPLNKPFAKKSGDRRGRNQRSPRISAKDRGKAYAIEQPEQRSAARAG